MKKTAQETYTKEEQEEIGKTCPKCETVLRTTTYEGGYWTVLSCPNCTFNIVWHK